MRLTAFATTAILLVATPAATQTLIPEPHPYGLDPYKPSDAALLRAYGSALVAQTPLLQLSQLDPYKPSEAALLRDIGGGIPLWSHFAWYPTAPPPAPLMLMPAPPANVAASQPASRVVVIVVQPKRESGDRDWQYAVFELPEGPIPASRP